MRRGHLGHVPWRLLLGFLLLVGGSTFSLGAPTPVDAHQPVVVDSGMTEVADPEISKAYYGRLAGEPQRYQIDATTAFDLYVGILVPDDGSPIKDVRAEIFRGEELLARLGGTEAVWTTFYEPREHLLGWGRVPTARSAWGLHHHRLEQ